MIEAITNEILQTTDFIAEKEIDTIYFGGGTPSLLSLNELREIIKAIFHKFHVNPNAEITLEANPDDIHSATLQGWLSAGINRLSIGIQSFNDDELTWMNRSHNAQQSLKCIDEIRKAGFENFSADLIYGSPLSSNDSLLRNTGIIIEKKIPHISCYALTVEPGTLLHANIRKKRSPGINEDNQANQFSLLVDIMEEAGYEHYEISNFARPGYRSRHNSSYWQGIPYYGFGPSAHSYNGSTRRWNIANNALYIQSLKKNIIPFDEEQLTRDQQFNEYIMTSLRTMEGTSMEVIRNNFLEYAEKLEVVAKKYIQSDYMTRSHDHLILTRKGKFLADGIASALFA